MIHKYMKHYVIQNEHRLAAELIKIVYQNPSLSHYLLEQSFIQSLYSPLIIILLYGTSSKL